MLANHYGDPAYWMNPDLPERVVATALDILEVAQHGR